MSRRSGFAACRHVRFPARAFARLAPAIAALVAASLVALPSFAPAQADSADASARAVEGVGGEARTTVTADVLQPERTFGLTLGDVLTQRVPLGEADTLEPGGLPAEGRVDVWFARLPVRVVRDGGGARHAELRYQIVNSPAAATVTSLPTTSLTFPDARRVELPGPSVSISPLLPGGDGATPGDGWPRLRPDRLLPPLDTAPAGRRAELSAFALALVLLAWFGWWVWRGRRDAVRLPFARAVDELRALDARRPDGGHRGDRERDTDPLAWRAVHGALNATAGRVHGPAELDALLARAPWLAAYRDRLAAFHDASAGRFFEQPPRIEPFDLRGLARELRRAERRQSR